MCHFHSEGSKSVNTADDGSAKRLVCDEAVRRNHSARGNSVPGPPPRATFPRASGASAVEYATVHDAIHRTGSASARAPLIHTPSVPLYSPPSTPPIPSPMVSLSPDQVLDVGYSSLPHSRELRKITKVRNAVQSVDQTSAVLADSPPSSFV